MKAVLKNGSICPSEPIPTAWGDGAELEIAIASNPDQSDGLDPWYAELEAACSQMDIEDDRIMKAAILDYRQQEKEFARKQAAQE